MAAHFLQPHQLYLTPLSSLHLGTGEDYQPTEYMIADGIMYVFHPEQAALNPDQYDDLMTAAQSGNPLTIQRYFKKHAAIFKDCAHKAISVSAAIEKEYHKKLGTTVQQERNGKKVHNKLFIERTATNPLTHQPYIPGSAFKGSVRTALLEHSAAQNPPSAPLRANKRETSGQSIAEFEKERLGDCSTSIMRLLKTADFMPAAEVSTQVQYSVNRRKHQADGNKKLSVRREVIQHGQYRAFAATCTLQTLLLEHSPKISKENSLPAAELQALNIQVLAKNVNAYHLRLWKRENQILEARGLLAPQWLQHTRQLIHNLKNQLDQGRIMLMRLGKNSSAESKTLSNWAQIEIRQGKGRQPKYQKHTTTAWLAAQSDKETHGLLPFGWVLVEIDPGGDNALLKQWCAHNSSHLSNTAALNAALTQGRRQTAARKQAYRQEQQRIKQEKQAAAAEKQRQAEAQAAMPPHQRLAVQWKQQLNQFHFDSRNQEAANAFYQTFRHALQEAAQNFDTSAQKHIAEALAWNKISKQQPMLFGRKREKEIKALLRRLRGE